MATNTTVYCRGRCSKAVVSDFPIELYCSITREIVDAFDFQKNKNVYFTFIVERLSSHQITQDTKYLVDSLFLMKANATVGLLRHWKEICR